MGVNKILYFKVKQFAAGELSLAVENICSTIFDSKYSVSASVTRKLSDGTMVDQQKDDPSLLSSICNLEKEHVSFYLTYAIRLKEGPLTGNIITASVSVNNGILVVYVKASSVEQLREFSQVFADKLKLDIIPDHELSTKWKSKGLMTWDDVAELAERVTNLECERAVSRRLTCFLSFRFEGHSLEYGRMVKQFLELLGVRVITGQGYEPKPVNEKVRSRLSESLDIIIIIETLDGKSSWTRDEIAKAQNPGIFLIPLVEEGTTFDAGIYGDHEYIQFSEGHISDAFIGLIEGIQYIERIRIPIVTKNTEAAKGLERT